jgi:hypothetical protein
MLKKKQSVKLYLCETRTFSDVDSDVRDWLDVRDSHGPQKWHITVSMKPTRGFVPTLCSSSADFEPGEGEAP